MPSPLKPLLHMQEKLPKVLVHIASAWQLCVPVEHSSTSDERKTITLGFIATKKRTKYSTVGYVFLCLFYLVAQYFCRHITVIILH